MKKTIAVLLMIILALSLAACVSRPVPPTQEPEQTPEEDGQNPIMNFVGPYVCDRCNMLVEADGMKGGKVTVTWAGSAFDQAEWVMSGPFDEDSLVMTYDNCTKTVRTYKEDGNVEKEEVIYENGKGTITFKEDDGIKLVWDDKEENAADGMTFEFHFVPEE